MATLREMREAKRKADYEAGMVFRYYLLESLTKYGFQLTEALLSKEVEGEPCELSIGLPLNEGRIRIEIAYKGQHGSVIMDGRSNYEQIIKGLLHNLKYSF